jgi:hypothetical protein
MLGKSVHTIRHLEAGSLKLSSALAARMNYESGISIQWLMDDDPTAPPITANGTPYTKAIYDEIQAHKKHFAIVKDDDVRSTVLDVLRSICAILVNTNRKRNFHLAAYRTAKALAELRDEFGEAKDFTGYDTVLDYLQLRMSRPFMTPPKRLPKVVDLSRLPDKQPTSKPQLKRSSSKKRRQ